MALLNSSDYKELEKNTTSNNSRVPTIFHSIFITGEMRTGQKIATMQCMRDFDAGEYILNNQDRVTIIPMFSKRYWHKTVEFQNEKGEKRSNIVAFGWNEDVPKIDDQCKYEYIIAGKLFDGSKVITHTKPNLDANIEVGDPVLAYFKLGGIKFGSVFDWQSLVEARVKGLTNLSDSPDFEKKVISWRRFLLEATVDSKPTAHGNKMVFKFALGPQVPDTAIEKLMNEAKKYDADFERQFDKTRSIKSGSSGSARSQSSPTVSDVRSNQPAESNPSPSGGGFDLGV